MSVNTYILMQVWSVLVRISSSLAGLFWWLSSGNKLNIHILFNHIWLKWWSDPHKQLVWDVVQHEALMLCDDILMSEYSNLFFTLIIVWWISSLPLSWNEKQFISKTRKWWSFVGWCLSTYWFFGGVLFVVDDHLPPLPMWNLALLCPQWKNSTHFWKINLINKL